MKTKKALLVIFLTLFLIPELLWSLVSSIFLSFVDVYSISRKSGADNFSADTLSVILWIQSFGAIGTAVMSFILAGFREKRALYATIGTLFIFVSLASLLSLFLSYALYSFGF